MYQPSLEDYIAQLLHSPSADIRRNAAWMLGRERSIRLVEPLCQAIYDEDLHVRIRVIEALANQHHVDAIPTLLELLQDESAAVQAQSLKGLALMAELAKQPDVCEQIERFLQDPEALLRADAAMALGQIQCPETVPALIQQLIQESDEGVIYALSHALIQFGKEDAHSIEILRSALDQIQKPKALTKALEVLGYIPQKESIDYLKIYLDHEDDTVYATAEWALERIQAKG
ncbi:hypothetical protein MASR2M15_07680 [Anaerolineales bacterium]